MKMEGTDLTPYPLSARGEGAKDRVFGNQQGKGLPTTFLPSPSPPLQGGERPPPLSAGGEGPGVR